MFAELPGSGSPLAAHYGYADKRGSLPAERGRRFGYGRSFDFYAANLQRKYGPDYLALWRDMALERLRAWGFNTIGNWSERELLGPSRTGLCRADSHIRKLRQSKRRVGQGARSVRSGVRRGG